MTREPCDPSKAGSPAEPKGFGWEIEGERGSEQGGAYERWLSMIFDVADPEWDAALERSRPSSRLKNEVCVYCFWDRDMSERPMRCRRCNGLLCSVACLRDHGPVFRKARLCARSEATKARCTTSKSGKGSIHARFPGRGQGDDAGGTLADRPSAREAAPFLWVAGPEGNQARWRGVHEPLMRVLRHRRGA